MLRLLLPHSNSLKDKRQVVKSLQKRLAQQFGVSVAEVGDPNSWRLADLGVAFVTNQISFAEQVLDAAVRYVEETRPDLEILEVSREMNTFFE